MENEQRKNGISGFTLKMIAVVSMLIDHSAATILERMLVYAPAGQYPFVDAHWTGVYVVYCVMRVIGRFAFPIYCYLIVEGFVHTRSVAKYAGRLFLFALISEVPFDLAFQRSVFDMSYNNVFFTLLLGLLAIALIRAVNDRLVWRGESGVLAVLAVVLRCAVDLAVILLCMTAAEELLCTDYGAGGVAMIVLLYLLRRYPKTSFAIAVVLLSSMCGVIELAALLMLVPFAFYNGTRGRQIKYFFYVFYPAHLLVLVGICALLGLA